jgi:D123
VDHDSHDDDEAVSPATKQYAFPEFDAQIRACIDKYGAVFPKLNFSSPKARPWREKLPFFLPFLSLSLFL